MQNQVYEREAWRTIKVNNPTVNGPSFIDYNDSVTADTAISRLAGCFLADAPGKLLVHNASYDDGTTRYTCSDGMLRGDRPPLDGSVRR